MGRRPFASPCRTTEQSNDRTSMMGSKRRTNVQIKVTPNPITNIRARTHQVGAFPHSCYQGNVTDPAFISIKLCIQTLRMQNIAPQRFVSRHDTAVTSFDIGGSRPRFQGWPTKGSRPPCVKRSQGRKNEMGPSDLARPRSKADRDISIFLVQF